MSSIFDYSFVERTRTRQVVQFGLEPGVTSYVGLRGNRSRVRARSWVERSG